MRLWACISLCILALVWPTTCSQVLLVSESTVASTTLVDALSDDPDYTSLLLLLQRAKLIPTLNKLNGSTLFAPTNDAIKHHSSFNSLWRSVLDDRTFVLNDNLHEKLRQELFYHLLNTTLPADPNPQVLKTLHYPKLLADPPKNDPPPSPPWMPIPGGTLGGEPQRLRIATRDESVWVGVDAFAQGGSKIVKKRVDAGNGVLLGISSVLDVPPNLTTVVSQHSSVSYFHKLLTPDISQLLQTATELTIFLPVNAAWDDLDPLERLYLESEWATDDLNRILKMHAVSKKTVKWSDTFGDATNLTTIDGNTLEIVVSPDRTQVSTAELIQPDIYASNGVLHLISSLLIPPGALELTPEKYLLTFNCSSFVSFIHSVNLTYLINDTSAQYTILAPSDDVLGVFGDGDLPERGTEELKKLLQYHFIPGRWSPKKLTDGMLLETALEETGLDGGKQVLAIEVSGGGQKKTQKTVTFGGARVTGDPIEVNSTLIYFLSRPLVPPVDALTTALPSLDLSSFLAAIFSTSLAEILKKTSRTTLLIPHNSAFKRVGLLVSEHLLSASSKSDLGKVIMHHVIDGVQYSQAIQNGTQRTFPTMEGTDLQLQRSENGTFFIVASGGWPSMKSELYPQNMLTQTGVIHEVSDLMIPRTVDVTVGKLVKAAKGSTMAGLMVKAGLDWVLNGTMPPEGSPWAEEGLTGVGWTLLCPTDNAFKKLNLTTLYDDIDSLRAVVSQHLIRVSPRFSQWGSDTMDVLNNRPIPLEDSAVYSTLLSSKSFYGDIVFREVADEGYMVGIKGARGTGGRTDWARVTSWGRSTTGGGTGGVIQIDQLLLPYQPTWWLAYGAPTVVGVVGMILICGFFLGVRVVWRRDTTEATYEPVGGFGRDDDP